MKNVSLTLFQCGLIFLCSVSLAFSREVPVYQLDWQQCKVDSDCVTLREGYNWTCVNKSFEKEARDFCANIDGDGHWREMDKETCKDISLKFLPVATCFNGMCLCQQQISTFSTQPPIADYEKCQKDDDCIVVKGGDVWGAINKNSKGPEYYPIYGSPCKMKYQYPKPLPSCDKGKCTIYGYLNEY